MPIAPVISVKPSLGGAWEIAARYEQLVSQAQARGELAVHCETGSECWTAASDDSIDVCGCDCDGCTRATELLLQAQGDDRA